MIFFRKASGIDQAILCEAFKQIGRDPVDCERYFTLRKQGECDILFAENKEKKLVGHAILLWKSRFKLHNADHTPEMMDVYIYPSFRRLGIATALLHHSEQLVKQMGLLKLGLGVMSGVEYSYTHSLYLKSGYHQIGTDILPEGEVVVYEKGL